jgi:hypothetical protein
MNSLSGGLRSGSRLYPVRSMTILGHPDLQRSANHGIVFDEKYSHLTAHPSVRRTTTYRQPPRLTEPCELGLD